MRTSITTLAAITAATVALTSPAEAAGRLTLSGTGASTVATTSISVTGHVSGSPLSGDYTGTVTVPGGVPALGTCSPAYADLTVGEAGGPRLGLHAEGEVCSVLTAWVLHAFRGRFVVSECSKRGWRNMTGFVEVRAVNGISDVYATS